MKIHLLEPFKTSLILQALDEGFIKSEFLDEFKEKRAKKSITQEIIYQTLQILLLYEDVSIFWPEYDDDTKQLSTKNKLSVLDISTLKSFELINTESIPDKIINEIRSKHIDNINIVWKNELDKIDTYERFILSQLNSVGIDFNYNLYRLIRAYRLGNNKSIPLIMSTIPETENKLVDYFLKNHNSKALIANVDFVLISKAIELKFIFEKAIKEKSKIAGAPPLFDYSSNETLSDRSNILYQIIIDELMGNDISLPAPKSIKEVIKFRQSSEIKDFRYNFFKLIDFVKNGDVESIKKMRKEIKLQSKIFKRYPNIKKLASFVSYVSLPISAIETILGFFGPSIILGVSAVGLERWAKKINENAGWLYFSYREKGN